MEPRSVVSKPGAEADEFEASLLTSSKVSHTTRTLPTVSITPSARRGFHMKMAGLTTVLGAVLPVAELRPAAGTGFPNGMIGF